MKRYTQKDIETMIRESIRLINELLSVPELPSRT
jgi:hypothetical protein